MKPNRSKWILLFTFVSAVFRLAAQQSETDRKLVSELRANAEKGDAQSQLDLGVAFYFGNLGVAKDHSEAVKWFRKSAEQNHAPAQFNLGGCYSTGPHS